MTKEEHDSCNQEISQLKAELNKTTKVLETVKGSLAESRGQEKKEGVK